VVTHGVNSATGVTERNPQAAPSAWQAAALTDKHPETATATTLLFDVDGWPGHRAGQHVDLRLTAEDGYQTSRSYSIASPPEDSRLALTVERIEDGEVSPYLVDVMEPGDELELRGPVGGWFVWDGDDRPLLLVAGGSGVVPLRAMLRHRAALRRSTPARLLVSARTLDDLIYGRELGELEAAADGPQIFVTLTREAPPRWDGYTRRIDREMLAEVAWDPGDRARTYVCGPTSFVEAAADALVALGHEPAEVRTERFGPTG
jgi:ferredoxin-NADP reductase